MRGGLGTCDLAQVDGPLRIQVKQSAARQSWHSDASPPGRPSFAIAHKTGRYDGLTWIAEPSRNAEIFIFAWHPVADDSGDHREPDQWQFFVVAERDLPLQKSISLSRLRSLASPVAFEGLKAEVIATAATLTPR